MDGMVGQHRYEQVRADTGVRAMPDWAQAELRLQLSEDAMEWTGCSHAKRHFQFLTPLKEF